MLEAGEQPPSAYFDRPAIAAHLQEYWLAFCDLTTERQIGMGLGPIPASQIRDYAIELDLDGDEAELFFAVIRQTDDGYLSIVNAQSGQAAGAAKEVRMDNVEGVRNLFETISEDRKKAVK